MHALTLFHKFFTRTFHFIHHHRLQCLLVTTESLLRGAHCSLTNLGRYMAGAAQVKHKIKRVDRLLGNPHLYEERWLIYQAIANQLLTGLSQAVIIVDWSPYHYADYYVLKATLAMTGRSVTLYEEVYPGKQQQQHLIHKLFVSRLKQILPQHLVIIVVTDAGFTNKWFKLILEQGWHFLGRIPNNYKYRSTTNIAWKKLNLLESLATAKPTLLGPIELAKSNPLPCQLVIYKQRLKGRKKTLQRQKNGDMERRYSLSQRSAWILATSANLSAEQVVNYYKLRMQIEQSFRDIKNTRWGLGLRYGHSHSLKRLEILLLLASIAHYMLWLIGWIAEQQSWHYNYQSNTIKHRRVLSFVYLGQQILYHQPKAISQMLWNSSIPILYSLLAAIHE